MNYYRPNSALILEKQDGSVLVAERCDVPGAWQFPQGGSKNSETPLKTLHREMIEEIGLSPESYEISCEKGPYRYDFLPGRKKEGFVGQEQTYFLARLLDESLLAEGKIQSKEFQAIRWIQPDEFNPLWIPEFKRKVYAAVFADFFGVAWLKNADMPEESRFS
jgi:putative (di)nucleoside polyphosphate hydrolase